MIGFFKCNMAYDRLFYLNLKPFCLFSICDGTDLMSSIFFLTLHLGYKLDKYLFYTTYCIYVCSLFLSVICYFYYLSTITKIFRAYTIPLDYMHDLYNII